MICKSRTASAMPSGSQCVRGRRHRPARAPRRSGRRMTKRAGHRHHEGEGFGGEPVGFLAPLAFQFTAIERHESRVERAFGQQPRRKVLGMVMAWKKVSGHRACAKTRRCQDFRAPVPPPCSGRVRLLMTPRLRNRRIV